MTDSEAADEIERCHKELERGAQKLSDLRAIIGEQAVRIGELEERLRWLRAEVAITGADREELAIRRRVR